MTNLDVLTADQLAQVVAGLGTHQVIRQATGMCGCGLVPDRGLHEAH
jgi:hypothetical protein